MGSNIEIQDVLKLIHPMSIEQKLEIIFRLTKEIRTDIPTKVKESSKDDLIDELYGSWKDMDERIIDEIISSRTISDRGIFDS